MTIQEIAKEMVKQNNRSTQNVMFAVEVDEVVVADRYNEDGFAQYYSIDGCSCDAQPGVCEDETEFDADLHDESCIGWFKKERRLKVNSCGVFFTAEACQAHIDANYYHYENPRVYGISSWRNPEMKAVQKHIIETSGEKVPSHYE